MGNANLLRRDAVPLGHRRIDLGIQRPKGRLINQPLALQGVDPATGNADVFPPRLKGSRGWGLSN
jgi:hypothetical protein